MSTAPKEVAREYIKSDLDDALGMVADVRKLIPSAELDAVAIAKLSLCLSRADTALKAARSRLLEATGGAR